MIQPKSINNENSLVPSLHKIGCLGKITSFKETDDGRYLIDLKGIIRFKIIKEIADNKPYRSCEINFEDYLNDLSEKKRKFKIFRLRINI
jgi:Uncharacterized protein, similar to the N-terminal domain of Lon protease